MPTLLLHGDADVALGTKLLDGVEAAFAADGLVEVSLLSPCSHWIQQDYPLQVNALMADFLRRRRPQRQSQRQ